MASGKAIIKCGTVVVYYSTYQ
eukprot:COSAG01_NODE_70294_length_259_cov_0.612500_1_plen_21_part_10